jgi:hypothetical protein
MQAEIWRPVVGFEQYYSVSSFGRVRRDKGGKGTKAGKILKISAAGRNKDGTTNYQTVSFCVNSRITGRNLHAVVAEVFIGPCPEGMEINHKDLDRNNPRADNLEYVTHVRNIQHAIENNQIGGGWAGLSKEERSLEMKKRGIKEKADSWWSRFTPEERSKIVKLQVCGVKITFPLPEITPEIEAILRINSKKGNDRKKELYVGGGE